MKAFVQTVTAMKNDYEIEVDIKSVKSMLGDMCLTKLTILTMREINKDTTDDKKRTQINHGLIQD